MGIACSAEKKEKPDEGPYSQMVNLARLSFFEDLGNDDKIKGKGEFKFAKEYKVGPFISGNSDASKTGPSQEAQKKNQEKIKAWQTMYQKQKQKLSHLNIDEENNGFVLTKLEKFLINYKEKRANSFYAKLEQGPPEVLRWSTWKATLQINEYFEMGLYESFIGTDEFDEPTKDQIQKDIVRTFPKQFYFSHKECKGLSIGHNQLERILFGISNYFPRLRYCQGMNFTLGFLLLISGGKEIDVFWSFIALIRNPKYLIMGIYQQDMPLLHLMEFMTEHLLKKHMLKFYEKLQELGVLNSFWLTKWYMTFFLYNFPISICQRVWDFMLVEGIFGLISLVIPIMKNFEKKFQAINELEALEFFHDLTKNEDELEKEDSPNYLNMDKITQEAKQYLLARKKVAKLTKRFLSQHAEKEMFQKTLQIYLLYDKPEEFTRKAKAQVDAETYFNLKGLAEDQFLDPNAILDLSQEKAGESGKSADKLHKSPGSGTKPPNASGNGSPARKADNAKKESEKFTSKTTESQVTNEDRTTQNSSDNSKPEQISVEPAQSSNQQASTESKKQSSAKDSVSGEKAQPSSKQKMDQSNEQPQPQSQLRAQ